MQSNNDTLLLKAQAVKLLCLDVDGTLTDGRLLIDQEGKVHRSFHTLDGLGIKRFFEAGGIVAIVTAAIDSPEIYFRASQLGISHVYQSVSDKLAVVNRIMAKEGLNTKQCGFVGDDLPDLEAMKNVGFSAAPSTAVDEILEISDYIIQKPAGGGAVREVCDFILSARSNHQ